MFFGGSNRSFGVWMYILHVADLWPSGWMSPLAQDVWGCFEDACYGSSWIRAHFASSAPWQVCVIVMVRPCDEKQAGHADKYHLWLTRTKPRPSRHKYRTHQYHWASTSSILKPSVSVSWWHPSSIDACIKSKHISDNQEGWVVGRMTAISLSVVWLPVRRVLIPN